MYISIARTMLCQFGTRTHLPDKETEAQTDRVTQRLDPAPNSFMTQEMPLERKRVLALGVHPAPLGF